MKKETANTTNTTIECPYCGGEMTQYEDASGYGDWWVCTVCGDIVDMA